LQIGFTGVETTSGPEWPVPLGDECTTWIRYRGVTANDLPPPMCIIP